MRFAANAQSSGS